MEHNLDDQSMNDSRRNINEILIKALSQSELHGPCGNLNVCPVKACTYKYEDYQDLELHVDSHIKK